MQIVDFRPNEYFLDKKKNSYKLVDILEIRSLLSGKSTEVIVRLTSTKTKKIKTIPYVFFESNFTKIVSGLHEEVESLNKLLK